MLKISLAGSRKKLLCKIPVKGHPNNVPKRDLHRRSQGSQRKISVQALFTRSLWKISVQGLLAGSRYKISIRALLARKSLYICTSSTAQGGGGSLKDIPGWQSESTDGLTGGWGCVFWRGCNGCSGHLTHNCWSCSVPCSFSAV